MNEGSNKIRSFADGILSSNQRDENDGKMIEKTNDCTVPEGTSVYDNLDEGGGGRLSHCHGK